MAGKDHKYRWAPNKPWHKKRPPVSWYAIGWQELWYSRHHKKAEALISDYSNHNNPRDETPSFWMACSDSLSNEQLSLNPINAAYKSDKVGNQHHGPLKLRELPWSPREGKSRAKGKWGTLREWPWEKANSGPKFTFLIHLSWELIKSSLFNIWVFRAQQKVPGSRIPRTLPHLSLWTELACCKYCFNITSWHFILVLSLMPSAEQALSKYLWITPTELFYF